MKQFTIADIRGWYPCYDPATYLAESWKGTALDMLNDGRIPLKDRLWVIMRTDLVSEKLMRQFAIWCARQVQHLMQDKRSLRALDVAEAYAENRSIVGDIEYAEAWKAELAAAQRVARAAANDAMLDVARSGKQNTAQSVARDAVVDAISTTAHTAARGAAFAAALAIAQDAAWNSTYTIARDRAWDTAYNTARMAAQATQEQKLRELLISGLKTGDTK
jgi:hypothetical protein